MNIISKTIGIINESCDPILQHLFFDIEPNLIALRTFLQSNHDTWTISGKTNNHAFKGYLTWWI